MSKKRILSLVLAILLLLSVFSTAAFAATPVPPTGINPITKGLITIQWTYINYVTTSLNISSTGSANVFGYIQRTTSGTYLYLSCTLQRYTNGTWVDITSWDTSSTSSSAIINEYYQVSSGKYRVKTYYYGSGNGAGSDFGVIYSKEVTY